MLATITRLAVKSIILIQFVLECGDAGRCCCMHMLWNEILVLLRLAGFSSYNAATYAEHICVYQDLLLANPWDVIQFSGNARIHLDSFLSVFNISGLPEEYYHNSQLSNDGDSFVDGAVIAAARTLPTWSNGDVPPIPSTERKAVKELQEECQQKLAEFPTTSEQDQRILDSKPEARRTLVAAI
ncbi:unnamed protein product, partial [Ilex paraguariensis]